MAKVGPSYKELHASLGKKQLFPVYLLQGEEDFLLERGFGEILDAAVPAENRDFNLEMLDCADVDAREITARASSMPMMGDKRAVVARNVDRLSAHDLEILQLYVDRPSESTVLILIARKADLRKKPFAGLHARGAAFDFAPVNEELLPVWVTNRVRARGGTIDEEGADLLAAYVGSSLREIDSEIEKLLIFVGKGTQITARHVADLVGFSREFTVFELQNVIGQGNLPRALNILEHMLSDGQPVVLLISMLTFYFVSIWKLHYYLSLPTPLNRGELMSKLRFSPKVLESYMDAARRYPAVHVERAFCLLAEADLQYKSTTLADSRDIMFGMLVQIMQTPQSAGSIQQ
jgi:DNA polymerase-3 subunit delta